MQRRWDSNRKLLVSFFDLVTSSKHSTSGQLKASSVNLDSRSKKVSLENFDFKMLILWLILIAVFVGRVWYRTAGRAKLNEYFLQHPEKRKIANQWINGMVLLALYTVSANIVYFLLFSDGADRFHSANPDAWKGYLAITFVLFIFSCVMTVVVLKRRKRP